MSLTKEEKSFVTGVFQSGKNKEKNFKVYNMTVARLYFGEQDNWQYSGHFGAAVIVSEYPKEEDETSSPYASYICLVDLTSGAIIFTQEIYDEFMYVKAKGYFHHFETNMSIAGLSFANEEEALEFYNCVVEVTHKTLTEKEEKKPVIPVTRPAKPRTPHGGDSFFDVVIADDKENDKKKKKRKRIRKHKKGSKDKKEAGEAADGKDKKETGEEKEKEDGEKKKKKHSKEKGDKKKSDKK